MTMVVEQAVANTAAHQDRGGAAPSAATVLPDGDIFDIAISEVERAAKAPHSGLDVTPQMIEKMVAALDIRDPSKLSELRGKLNAAFPPDASGNPWPAMSSTELDKRDFTITWEIHGVMASLQNIITAGIAKGMKTTTMIDAYVSLASGTRFLNYFDTGPPKPVLLVCGESGEATLQETARRVCDSKDINLKDIPFFTTIEVPSIADVDHLGRLRSRFSLDGIKCCAVDPAYFAIDGDDAGNMFSMGKQLKPFGDMCREAGVTSNLIHHTKKLDPKRIHTPLELQDIAWAGFMEFARQWFLFNRREPFVPGSGSHKLWFSFGGSAGHSGLFAIDIEEGTGTAADKRSWKVEVKPASEAIDESVGQRQAAKIAAKDKAFETRLSDTLNLFSSRPGDPQTKQDVRAHLRCSGEVANQVVHHLEMRQDIKRAEMVKRGKSLAEAWMMPSDLQIPE